MSTSLDKLTYLYIDFLVEFILFIYSVEQCIYPLGVKNTYSLDL